MKRIKWENIIFLIYLVYAVYSIYYHIAICGGNKLMLEVFTYSLIGLSIRMAVKYMRLHTKEIRKDLKLIFID